MKIVLDLNIWIDIAARPKSYPHSQKLLRSLEQSHHTICFPLCGYTTVYYLLHQLIGVKGALDFLRLLDERNTSFLTFSPKEVSLAHKLSFKDFEDACIAASAINNNCEYIVTRNLSDYSKSPIPALNPKKMLKLLT